MTSGGEGALRNGPMLQRRGHSLTDIINRNCRPIWAFTISACLRFVKLKQYLPETMASKRSATGITGSPATDCLSVPFRRCWSPENRIFRSDRPGPITPGMVFGQEGTRNGLSRSKPILADTMTDGTSNISAPPSATRVTCALMESQFW